MNRLVKIFLIGLLISFLGSLPLGTLNMTAFQIAGFQNVSEAMLYALAVVFVELVVVRITLAYSKKIDLGNRVFFYLLPIAIALLMYLSVSSFTSLKDDQAIQAGSNLFPMLKSSILLGLLLSFLNPMHIPFWTTWNSVLIAKNRLDRKPGMYTSYITGIGIGSIGGLMIFVFAGKYIFQNYHEYSYVIAFILGCLYLGFSFYLLFLLYKNHLKLIIH
ncbi:Threonine/homoserine/homoserine lactone efflux protein [Pricia antarctica]|uniref:Threonine/homoserine/homoserine lactone efflux protein n=1 Tax=Pricia antarctica TaxID=641691 RepID=A0A1G7JAJ8_9FLAO|nr:hypothetical protein [Pricia antarctica]SDF22007.1 Threonine/homoserine/homoserine lactone efflux protein [Pricia antarctica]